MEVKIVFPIIPSYELRLATRRILLLLPILYLASSCANNKMKEEEIAPSVVDTSKRPLSFKLDIQPIFQNNCIECHSATSTNPDRYRFAFFDNLSQLKTFATTASTVDKKYSVIQARLRGIEKPAMPYNRPPLPDSLIQKIDAWTSMGAPVE